GEVCEFEVCPPSTSALSIDILNVLCGRFRARLAVTGEADFSRRVGKARVPGFGNRNFGATGLICHGRRPEKRSERSNCNERQRSSHLRPRGQINNQKCRRDTLGMLKSPPPPRGLM